ncbi:hypothetical protein BKA58DRAFT_148277 [Alternaria rosae]|uniref:uncharacterized protein n=1 Tax=Alternaria rosae TaxID=1187941 RepID=UPI001E8CCBFC|nr:uncharacterized protein BKA58DRAFT_148277 [Alternaria rosae]KAH6872568.1 hypothetical protein BKA58DRAFT_148277 [Alternaria rosae]
MLEFNRDAGIEMWDVAKYNSEHKRDLRWLLNAVNNPNASPSGASALKRSRASKHERQIVVVTSFAPYLSCSLDPWHVDAPWASAYGTDLLHNPHFRSVKMWMSGMTGRTCEFKRGDIVVVSNQRGRESEYATGLLKKGMSDEQKTGLFDGMRGVKI